MDGEPNTPVRGLATAERDRWTDDLDRTLRLVRDALATARQAIQEADDLMSLGIQAVTLEPHLDRHGAERVAVLAGPVLHAGDLVRQVRRTGVSDTLEAAEALTHSLDVLRGWVV